MLNKAYDSNYKGFDKVVPLTTEEATDRKNYASWLDHRSFMDISLTQFFLMVKEELRIHDPEGRVALSGTPTVHNPYSGYNWEMLMKKVFAGQFLFPYGGLQQEFQRSFATKDTRILPPRGYTTVGKPVINSTWNDAFYYKGVGWYYFTSSVALNEDFTFSRQLSDLLDASADLRQGIGRILMEADNVYDGIAVLYSQGSMRMTSILGDGNKFVSNLRGWSDLLHEAGWKYKFVGAEDIKGLLNAGYTTLILPYNTMLDTDEIADIRKYVSKGGILIADIAAGVYNRHGRKYKTDPMARIFGISRPDGQVVSGQLIPEASWLSQNRRGK